MKILLALLLLSVPAAAAEDLSVVETRGIIDAPIEKVWAAWTTAAGLESWMAGQARVELRPGGELLARYRKEGRLGDEETIVHTLVAFDPNHLLVFKPARAKGFPFKDAWLKTWNILYLRATADGKTELVQRQLGYDTTPESQKMRSFFVTGNKETLETLQKHFAH